MDGPYFKETSSVKSLAGTVTRSGKNVREKTNLMNVLKNGRYEIIKRAALEQVKKKSTRTEHKIFFLTSV